MFCVKCTDPTSRSSSSLDLHSRGRKLVLRLWRRLAVRTKIQQERPRPEACDRRQGKGQELLATQINRHLVSMRSRLGSSQAAFFLCRHRPGRVRLLLRSRSSHACAQAEPHKRGNVGPGSVFGLIFVIAVLVYAIGGVCYNRTVAHARGWRQLPNYSLWAGIWSFVTVCSASPKPGLPISRRGS